MNNILTIEDVAKLLKVEQKTIQWWTRIRLIPFVKIGKTIRYFESDVLSWVERQKVGG